MTPIEAAGHAADIEMSRQLEAEEGADFAAVGRAAITAFLGAVGEDEKMAAQVAAAYITCWPVEQTANAFALMPKETAMTVVRAVLAALKEMVEE